MSASGLQPLTLPLILAAAARRQPDKVALRCGGDVRRYGQLLEAIGKTAALAQDLGLVRGDIVLLASGSRIEYIELVLGFSHVGCIVATINPRLAAPEALALAADSGARIALLDAAAEPIADALNAAGVRVLRIEHDLQALLARASGALGEGCAQEADAFALSYTSGTTGRPKGVLLSHRSRALTVLAMAGEYGCFGPRDAFLAVTPLFHGAGFAYALANLLYGGEVVIETRADPDVIARHFRSNAVSGLFVVPTIMQRLLALSPAETPRPAALKSVICNAAGLPQPVKEAFVARFGAGLLHETYGSTEAGIVTNLGPDDQLRTVNSCGRTFTGVEAVLLRPDGAPAETGEIGELFSRSLYGFNGYLNRPEETADTMRDGWISVGDLAVRDSEGFFHIVGRQKDVIITGGVNVYPREIELVLERASGVGEAAVVGVADPEWGERVEAFIVAAEPGSPPSAAALAQVCRAALSAHKAPRAFHFIDAMPRNASGKLLRKDLRARAVPDN